MLNRVLILSFLFVSNLVSGQVVYDNFYLSQQDNVVLIQWTVKSGSLCNGTTVFRKAADGSDVQVGYIDGICGSEIEDQSYSIIDVSPELNADNTYYIQFGFGEYTEEKSIYVRYLDPEKLYLSPNPVQTSVKIEWNDQFHEVYTVRIIDAYGQEIAVETDVLGNMYQLPVELYPPGIYSVQLSTQEGKQLQTRLVKI